MRFVAVSDTHMAEPQLPEGDVLLHAGDLTFQGSLPEVSAAARWLDEQRRKRKYKHVIAGPGDRARSNLLRRDEKTPRIGPLSIGTFRLPWKNPPNTFEGHDP